MSGEGLMANAGRPRAADPAIVEKVAEILAATLRRHDHAARFDDPALELRADLAADELDMVSIAVDMEEAFGFDLSDALLARIGTIGDLHCFAVSGGL